MLLTMLKAKIHRAVVTAVDLNYAGSITIDEELLEAAGILPYEQVQVVNTANGARFETYAIPGPRGGGTVALNGAAARLGLPGDRVIIMAYARMEEDEARAHRPAVVTVDAGNKVLPSNGKA
ncbi:MAG: aspartate 1-decarboxylase [Thermoanaerobacterales bacterium]|nr:aspartate 1-decarboxylase [Bacillota bacterium]MDI6907769.1 aspartate 1-decarboxylase [Thermoanaerobacterales bacterium]